MTEGDVADEIDQFPSAGVFLKKDNQLVSWVTNHPPYGLSRLHTLDEHRRKGYAAVAVRYMTKRMAQAGYIPCLGIITRNSASKSLFESIGFRRDRIVHVIGILLPTNHTFR